MHIHVHDIIQDGAQKANERNMKTCKSSLYAQDTQA